MKDMKLEKGERYGGCETVSEPDYPYGLKVHVDEHSFSKLGLDKAPEVGKTVMIMAEAKVCDVHQYESDGEAKHSMGLQITAMEVKPAKADDKDIAGSLYDKD